MYVRSEEVNKLLRFGELSNSQFGILTLAPCKKRKFLASKAAISMVLNLRDSYEEMVNRLAYTRNKVAEHEIGYLKKASHIRQMENVSSSWEFPKIENEQIKTAQNNSYG